jgi:hypothetical protein
MDYRKAITGKKKLKGTIDSIKGFASNSSKKVSDFATTSFDDIKNTTKDTLSSAKTTISDKAKSKLLNEFRKNYPAYAIADIDSKVVNTLVDGEAVISISLNKVDDAISIEEIIDEISEGMVPEELLGKYKSDAVKTSLFTFIVVYYEAEEQLDTVVEDNVLTIKLKEIPVEEPIEEVLDDSPEEEYPADDEPVAGDVSTDEAKED